MLDTLGEKIHDNRLLRLIGQMLAAGYLEDWVWNATLSGVPQGGVLSPCLSNIYLDRLDKFVDTALMPEYTRGCSGEHNPEYKRIAERASCVPATAAIMPRCGRCASSNAASLPWIHTIPAIGGCVT